jgi:putative phosphoesterase
MLCIAVIADTHDRFPDSVGMAIARADEIWHLGDVCREATLERIKRLGPPVTVVKGNLDFFQPWPKEVVLERGGQAFRLTHIPPKPARIEGGGFLLHGHTHIPRDEMIGGVRVLNPGTIGKPNKGYPPSYAWMEIGDDGSIDWRIVPV